MPGIGQGDRNERVMVREDIRKKHEYTAEMKVQLQARNHAQELSRLQARAIELCGSR